MLGAQNVIILNAADDAGDITILNAAQNKSHFVKQTNALKAKPASPAHRHEQVHTQRKMSMVFVWSAVEVARLL